MVKFYCIVDKLDFGATRGRSEVVVYLQLNESSGYMRSLLLYIVIMTVTKMTILQDVKVTNIVVMLIHVFYIICYYFFRICLTVKL